MLRFFTFLLFLYQKVDCRNASAEMKLLQCKMVDESKLALLKNYG